MVLMIVEGMLSLCANEQASHILMLALFPKYDFVIWTCFFSMSHLQGIRGEDKVSSEVDVSELINFVLRDSGMHINIAIGIAYVSQLSFVVVVVVDVVVVVVVFVDVVDG